jgi:hypothetical protein
MAGSHPPYFSHCQRATNSTTRPPPINQFVVAFANLSYANNLYKLTYIYQS